ncbi:MAG TPA: tetratricopeptide repeat protein [Candidatus Kapabacteria bacterium]|nr:tetratricopeptide repeat protein [Candidatus Kapabacteria bacterium]
MKNVTFLLLTLIILAACTPVGARNQSPAKGNSAASQTKSRFNDTTFIDINFTPPKELTKSVQAMNDELKQAIDLYHDSKFNEACEIFARLLTNTNKQAKDYQILLYYSSECYIAKNMFEPAKKLLIDVLSLDELFDDIKEKALVRLGQVYCIENKKAEADRLFRQLRREYPQSKYIKLADCDAIKSN